MRKADAEARVETRNAKVGEFIQALTEGRGAAGVPDGVVVRVTIRLPTQDEPEALLVVKVQSGEDAYVAFVGGLDVAQAVLVWRAKDSAGGLKWREDVPWGQRG